MITFLSSRDGVKARKKVQCCFCLEAINPGETKDVRNGVDSDGFWKMEMHPECHSYESKQMRYRINYDDLGFEAAFTREDAKNYHQNQK